MKNNEKQEKDLEEYLLKYIPISSALGINVVAATPSHVVLSAPFANNINHKRTVFGGSLHAVATLACWSLLHLNIQKSCKAGIQIVIANSETKYLAPIAVDFRAECHKPDAQEWERFLHMLEKRGKARIKLRATISDGDHHCVNFTGLFVAIARNEQEIA